jgi:hypothetical protein
MSVKNAVKKITQRRSTSGQVIHIKDASGKYCRLYDTGSHAKAIEGKKGLISNVYLYEDMGVNILFFDLEEGMGKNFLVNKTTECRHLTVTSKRTRDQMKKYLSHLVHVAPTSGVNIGTDPEVFITSKNGHILPAFTFLPAKGGGNPFWDGFQAEFTVQSGGCLAYLTDRVASTLQVLYKKARTVDPECRMTWKSVIDIPEPVMRAADFKHADLGCAPSQNVYEGTKQLDVGNPKAILYRSAGCHLHFGLQGKYTKEQMQKMVKALDAIVGVLSVHLFRGMEDKRRRKMYGRAGEYRFPKHGLEYRTLSSAMLAHPVCWHLLFDLARCALAQGENEVPLIWHVDEKSVRRAIDNLDLGLAADIIKENRSGLEAILDRRYGKWKRDKVMPLIDEGALSFFDGLEKMEDYWALNSGQSWTQHSGNPDGCVEHLNKSSEDAERYDEDMEEYDGDEDYY